MNATDPANRALQTKSKSRVNEGAVLPEVEIPAVCVERQTFLFDARQQLVVIVFAL